MKSSPPLKQVRADWEINMDQVSDWLFDAPWWLLIAVGVTGIGLAVYAMPRRDRKLLLVAVAVVVLTGVWALLSAMIMTSQEQAETRVQGLIEAFEQGDWTRFDTLLDPETRFFNRLKGPEITEQARQADERFNIGELTVLSQEVRRDELGVVIDIRLLSQHDLSFARSATTAWRFDFRERAGDLRLEHIEPLATDRADLPGILEDIDWQNLPFR